MQDFYIGIDVGTGSARACIIDDSGNIRGIASEDIKLWTPENGRYEQSTTDIWNCICTSVRRALSHNSDISPTRIRGIGIAATCSLAIFDRTSTDPLPIPVTGPGFKNDGSDRNVILWLDHRAVSETAKINASGHEVLRYVGGRMSVEMEVPKMLWLKNNMDPELFDRCKFYDLADALTFLATGEQTRSYCSTVCKQGYIPAGIEGDAHGGWQKDFFQDIGLGDLAKDDFDAVGGVNGLNGKYLSAGEFVGELSKRASCELGLPEGIAVGSGIIDAYAGWVGTVGTKLQLPITSVDGTNCGVNVASSRLAAVAGTSTCHLAISPNPVFVSGIWGPYRDVLIPDFWMAEGGQSATGELLKHVVETHAAFKDALAQAGDVSIYEYLNRLLEDTAGKELAPSISYLGRHFFFYGDLWGNRSPVADSTMTGALIGLTSDRSILSLALHYYGALEFIALQTRQIVEAMNISGHSITSIFMSGSQCQNKLLMELIANTCSMAVVIPKYVTAAVVHGAAMLGVKAASKTENRNGNLEDLWTIMERMSQPGRIILPSSNKGERNLLDVKYSVFLEMCKTQRRYREEVDEAVKNWKYDRVVR